ncbi:MAG: hypothetical protein RLZZ344_514 [Pseudomonadota bacterium]|jgi:DNA repair protein RadC
MTHHPVLYSRLSVTETTSITDLGDERPREKLLARGVNSLSDAELLAVLLQTGTRDINCLTLAKHLLSELGSLAAVLSAPLTQVVRQPGIGTAKFSLLQAAGEASRRAARAQFPTGQPIPSPLALAPWLRTHLSGRPHEVFGAAFLDRRLRLIRIEELFRGSLSETSVYPREIVSRALQLNASRLVIFHNHPSGLAEPSQADRQLTIRLRQLLQQLEIDLWAHLLVAGESVTELECMY